MDKLEHAIALYKDGASLIHAWKTTGCGRNKLQEALKERGYTRSNKVNSRRYTVNEDFFESIDTELKAYWLGFVYADGYVSNRGLQKSIGIALGQKDKGHLQKFVEALESNYPVHDYEGNSYGKKIQYSRVLMTSDKMFNDLVAKGVTEHKTLILTFPDSNIVPDHLIHHFIRGYFDGDGSFAKDGQGSYRIKIEGTKDFLLQLAWKCGYLVNSTNLYTRHERATSYNLEFASKADIREVSDFMYEDATVYLDRKHERYEQISPTVQ